MSACSDDAPKGPAATPLLDLFAGVTPGPAAGSVDRQAIGGDALTVASAHAAPASVAADGTFATRVSDVGAQLLFVVDAAGEARALALAAPGSTGATAPASLVVDAESTALGLMFLVPGLGSSDLDEAAPIVAELRGDAAFGALVSYLAGALPGASLSDLMTPGGELEARAVAVVEAWLERHPLTAEVDDALTIVGDPDADLRVHDPAPENASGRHVAVDITAQAGAGRASVALQSRAWRYLDVQRRVWPGGAVESLTSCPLGLLDGVRGASWGTLFTGGFGAPTRTQADDVDLGGALWVEYWFRGPGLQVPQHTPPLPDGLARVDGCATVMSTFMYVALPVISIVGGLGKALDLGGVKVAALKTELWALVRDVTRGRGIVKALEAMEAKIAAGDTAGFGRAAIDLAVAVIGGLAVLAEVEVATVGGAGVVLTAATYLAPILTIGSGAMSVANVTMAVSRWVGLPSHSVQYVARPLYGFTIEAAPSSALADGEDAIVVSVDVGRYGWTQDPHLDFLATPPAAPSEDAGLALPLTLRALASPDGPNAALFTASQSPTIGLTTTTSGFASAGDLTCDTPGTYALALDGPHDDLVALGGAAPTVEFREVIWDAARDFSGVDNPNGAWSVGWAAAAGAPFLLFESGFESDCGRVWGGFGRLATPAVWRNDCTATRDGVAPGQVSLHPGCDADELAVLRWTAPRAGRYAVDLAWFAGDHGGADWPPYAGETEAFVRRDEVVIATFPATESGPTWAESMALEAGDTLDFAVGTLGHCLYDNTPLELVIRPAP